MSNAAVSLPWSILDRLFPFYLAFDRTLRVVRVGEGLARLANLRVGDSLLDVVHIGGLPIKQSFDELMAMRGKNLALSIQEPEVRLQGELVDQSSAGMLLFIGSPNVPGISDQRLVAILEEADSQPATKATFDALAGRVVEQGEALRMSQARHRENEERLSRAISELAEAKERAEAAVRAKNAFLATMSHELRTPLNAVIGMTSLLIETKLDAAQRDYTETVRRSSESLLSLINDLLDFSKIEAGRLEIEKAPFELRGCIEDSVELVAGAAAGKHLDLAFVIDPALPRDVIGDMSRIRQVLVNLLSNAVKFTPKGSVTLEVGFARSAKSAGRLVTASMSAPDVFAPRPDTVSVELTVTDTGVGIAEAHLPKLFEPFSQADAGIARRFGGTGLGLAICRRLVSHMGGTIRVESQLDRGSTFTVTLPFVEHRHEPPRVAPLDGLKVIVRDDENTHARALGALLMDLGAKLVYDESRAAVRIVARERDVASTVPTVLVASKDDIRGTMTVPTVARPARRAQLLRAIQEALGTPSASAEPVIERAQAASPIRILIAEDNPVNQKVALLMLQRLGQAADVVADGREAVEALMRRPYDLILMDVQMPEMDGRAAARVIRQELKNTSVKIVAMTAEAMQEDRDRCIAAGMDGYLSKPVRLPELAEWVGRSVVPLAGSDAVWLDESQLRQLGLDAASMAEMVDVWANDAGQRLGLLREAGLAGNVTRVKQLSHMLRGSSSTFGAKELTMKLAALEGEPSKATEAEVHGELAMIFERTVESLRTYVADAGR